MSSVSHIDETALETLQALHDTLQRQHVSLHFSEIKGPVFDRLEHTKLIEHLSGKVYLSAWDAFAELPEPLGEGRPGNVGAFTATSGPRRD